LAVLALVLGLANRAAVADEGPLQLKPSDRISAPAATPLAPVPPLLPNEGLELKLERQILPAVAAAFDASQMAEVLVEADVNRQRLNDSVIMLRAPDGSFLVAGEDLDRWRVRRPESPGLDYRGQRYYPITELPGATYKFDPAKLALEIQTQAGAFSETESAVATSRLRTLIPPQPGGFFNYDVAATKSSSSSLTGGIFEAGFFGRHGVVTTSATAPDFGDSTSWHRLDTTYTVDQPDALTTTRFGDSITASGAWGRAVRFGGFQYGTNFNTQPGFIRYPVLSAVGQATLPSTVDVFVNNALVARRSLPPGPFSITNIPVVTGAGNIQVVVRDLLGREQFINTPFYGSSTLLKPGLSDFSYEAGFARQDFGLASTHYAGGVGSATYRRGLTQDLTGEVRGEFDNASRAIGSAAAARFSTLGIVSATSALSSSDHGTGALLGFGIERNSNPFIASFQSTITSSEFRQAGMRSDELPKRRQTQASAGFQMGAPGSISLTYATQVFRDAPALQVLTAGYSLPIGKIGQLGLTGVKTYGDLGGLSLFLTFTLPLDAVTSATLSLEHRTSNATGLTEDVPSAVLQRSLPLGEGYGYRAQWRQDELQGRFDWQAAPGRYSLEASLPKDGGATYRIGAAGGIGTIGGYYFLSRNITDSFAVVHVADYENVRVLQDNQVVGRTNSQGYAVLPRLRPYDANPIALEQADLPLDAKISTLKLSAAPYFRSGVFVEFPIARVRAATLHIILEDGSDLPSGALGRIEGKSEEFPVALRGEAYLEGFEKVNRLQFSWKGQQCSIEVVYPKTDDPLPNLGTHLCKGVRP